MHFDRERLQKCDSIFFMVADRCENSEKYFELFVIMTEKITDDERMELRRTISVRSMGPRVAVSIAQLEKIYWLNSLPFVETISAATDPDLDDILRRLTRPPNVKNTNTTWFQRFLDRIGRLFGKS